MVHMLSYMPSAAQYCECEGNLDETTETQKIRREAVPQNIKFLEQNLLRCRRRDKYNYINSFKHCLRAYALSN